MEHPRATIAVKRLDDDITMSIAEARISATSRVISVSGVTGEIEHHQLFRTVAHPERVVHDQRIGADAIQQMGRCDIAHIERRVLAQPDDIELGQIDSDPVPEINISARAEA